MGFRSSALNPFALHRPAALAWLPAILLLGCAQQPASQQPVAAGPAAAAHSEAVPGPLYTLLHHSLPLPEGRIEVLRLHGQGSQIFRCDAVAAGPRWVYRLPEAELAGADGRVAVHHGANLSFEHVDGSRLVGEIVDHVAAPADNSLPWILMTTRSFGTGVLAGVTHVQRIDTLGGMPPPQCDAAQLGQVLRVPFSADFVFFR